MLYNKQILFVILILCIFFTSGCYATRSTKVINPKDESMRQRVLNAKEITVKIIVNGHPAGSGFVVSSNGLIITCFHVVQSLQPAPNNQTNITYAQNIEVEFNNNTRLPATVHPTCQNNGFMQALSKDYCLLQVNAQNLFTLPIGNFSDIQEGDEIYLCGYPLGISQSVVSNGMLSTKWSTSGYLGQGNSRDVAWLDITMNNGNSGGPIILLSDNPANDKIIGIATFGLNPFAKQAEELVKMVQGFPGNVAIMGVDFKKFSTLIGTALATNSLGVNGCVAIDYLKTVIPQ